MIGAMNAWKDKFLVKLWYLEENETEVRNVLNEFEIRFLF